MCMLMCEHVCICQWVCVWVWAWACMWVRAPQYMCVGQRTACGIWFLFTMWVQGIKLRAQRLGASTFIHSHFTSSSELYIKKRMQECFLCLGRPLPRTHYCWVQPSAFVPKCLPLSGAAEEGVGTDFYGFQLLSSSSFSLFSIFIFSFCSYVAFRTPGKHNILNGQSFGKQKLLLQITSALGAIT